MARKIEAELTFEVKVNGILNQGAFGAKDIRINTIIIKVSGEDNPFSGNVCAFEGTAALFLLRDSIEGLEKITEEGVLDNTDEKRKDAEKDSSYLREEGIRILKDGTITDKRKGDENEYGSGNNYS